MAMAAWVVGLALQLQQSRLTALAWAQSACALAVLMVLMSVWLMRSKPKLRAAWPLVWLACACLAWGSTTWRAHALTQQTLPPSWQDQDLLLQGQVVGLPTLRAGSLGFDVAVQSLTLQGKALEQGMPERVMLYWRFDAAMPQVQAGQVWRWTVRLQSPVATGNPGGFDVALWLLDKGVRASGSVRHKKGPPPQLLQSPGHWWSAGAVDRLRQAIRQSIQRQVPDARLSGVLAGLTIGDQSAIVVADNKVVSRHPWERPLFRKVA